MTAARRVTPMNVDWSLYGPCPREGCGATVGKPCINQKSGTATRNPHPDRQLLPVDSAEDRRPAEAVSDAQEPAQIPDEPKTPDLLVVCVRGEHFLYDGEVFMPIEYHVIP